MSLPIFRAVAHPWQCDVMGHLTTRFYVAVFDDASYHVLHALFGWSGGDVSGRGIGVADVRHEIEYLAEVGAGDLLEVSTRLDRLGGKSATLVYDMANLTRDGESAARLLQISTCFDTQARRAMPWPDDMRSHASPFLPAD